MHQIIFLLRLLSSISAISVNATTFIHLILALIGGQLYLEKDLFSFMDIEKAYDRVDRDALWSVLKIYGVGGQLLKAIQ